jgi:anaerobic selenocysteine-containing dehydrogenase
MIHPEDAAVHGIAAGEGVVLGNRLGEVRLHARLFAGVRRGVLIAESLWPNSAYADGCGINTLTGADAIAPFGGAAFHDNRVWVRRAAPDPDASCEEEEKARPRPPPRWGNAGRSELFDSIG